MNYSKPRFRVSLAGCGGGGRPLRVSGDRLLRFMQTPVSVPHQIPASTHEASTHCSSCQPASVTLSLRPPSSYAQTPTVAESGKSAIFKVKYECRLSKLFGEPRELQLYVSWTFELLSRYLFFSWVTIIFGTSREEVEVCNEKCCSMQFAVHIRASNEGLQRFHNHGEGSYQGDLREDLKKDATLIIFTLSKMLGDACGMPQNPCSHGLYPLYTIFCGLMPT